MRLTLTASSVHIRLLFQYSIEMTYNKITIAQVQNKFEFDSHESYGIWKDMTFWRRESVDSKHDQRAFKIAWKWVRAMFFVVSTTQYIHSVVFENIYHDNNAIDDKMWHKLKRARTKR